MQKLRLFCLGVFIVHFFSAAAGGDQVAGLQLFQMMGDRRTAHAYHGGDIDDTFLSVAQDPEDTDTVPVAELFENIR